VKVVWSPLAEQRALEAVEYIAQDRKRMAAVWLEKLPARVGKIALFEPQGRSVPKQ
jgi:plasmid stabilization system protein ParE